MSEPKLLTRVEGRVFHLTLNRPERHNAIDPELNFLMQDAMNRFAADDALWIAVLRGAGAKAFSAGGDLKAMMQASMGGEPYTIPENGYGGLTSRFDLDKPVIAVINGLAFGGGFEIAMASDLVIAADHAEFALPEPKAGIVAYAGGVHRLARQIPQKRALQMLLTSKRISATQALEWGLVNEVVPYAELDAATERWVNRILENAPLALRATKQMLCKGGDLTLQDAILGQEQPGFYPALDKMRTSSDVMEGIMAFVEKRPANWRGE